MRNRIRCAVLPAPAGAADRRTVVLAVGAALLIPAARVWGQAAPPPGTGPGLELTPPQRQLIYASISKQTHQSTAAPPTFQAQVGGHVPDGVELSPMPDTLVEMVPQTRNHAYAFVGGQVLIVEPKARLIVDIIAQAAT